MIEPVNRCFLYVDIEDASYIGPLIDDGSFCRSVVEMLLANRNKAITDIRTLDVKLTL